MKANQVGIRYGYRRIKAMLRSAGWVVNVNRVARIVATSENVRFGSKADILRGNINPPLLPAKLFPASTHTGHKLPAVGSYTIAHIARISAASARTPACAA